MDKMKQIYDFINRFWKFIKHTSIPAQNDNDAWEKILEDAAELTIKHQTSDPLDVMFRVWVASYLQYMHDISIGMPTLMQECNEVVKAI